MADLKPLLYLAGLGAVIAAARSKKTAAAPKPTTEVDTKFMLVPFTEGRTTQVPGDAGFYVKVQWPATSPWRYQVIGADGVPVVVERFDHAIGFEMPSQLPAGTGVDVAVVAVDPSDPEETPIGEHRIQFIGDATGFMVVPFTDGARTDVPGEAGYYVVVKGAPGSPWQYRAIGHDGAVVSGDREIRLEKLAPLPAGSFEETIVQAYDPADPTTPLGTHSIRFVGGL